MTDLTPRNALKMYRHNSALSENEQVKMFLEMPVSDRIELLMYMSMHAASTIQYIHSLIDPNDAKIKSIPDEKTGD